MDAYGLSTALREFQLLFAPGHLLRRAHQRSYELFSGTVGGSLTRQQAALLIALAQRPGASQNELVAETGMDKSTLKEMLGRMISRGLVRRERAPEDRRAWRLHVSTEGAQLLSKIMPLIEAAQAEILAPLPEAYRALFIRLLRVLVGLESASDVLASAPRI